MSDDGRDLANLLASPIREDDPADRPRGEHWAIAVGIGVGALAVVAGFWVAQSTIDSPAIPEPVAVDTTVGVPSTLPPSAAGDVPFPPGYEPVTDLVAIKPVRGLEAHDTLFITVNTAVRRGFDPSRSAPFQSGRWTLQTSAGDVLSSAGTSFDMTVPGVFSILFPLEGRIGVQPTQLTLDQRWQRDEDFQSVDLEVDELPYELPEPIDVPLASSTMRIERLSLTSDGGELDWAMSNDRQAAVQLWLRLGNPSDPAMLYRGSGSETFGFFGRSVFADPEGTSGTVALVPVNTESSGELDGQAAIDLQVALFTAIPGNAVFDLSELPIDRSG
jgi:hypothetical protein